MSVYKESLQLRSRDVDMYRRLRLSKMFELFQEASIRHTEKLGMGREKTLDKGILWVLLMQRAEITRMPVYDEEIVLRSWPGKTLHLLFPRHYSIETKKGEVLVRASALWSLVDAKTRKVVFPERYGVEIAGVRRKGEIPLPNTVPKRACSNENSFTVPFSFVDLNGHMNNTRYFDLAEDSIGLAAQGLQLRSIATEYVSEARLGETLKIGWENERNEIYLAGDSEKPVFRMILKYDNEIDQR